MALRTVRTWLETGDNRTKIDRIVFCTFMDVGMLYLHFTEQIACPYDGLASYSYRCAVI
jgi:uncharacterized protein (DUF427 family)